MRDPTLKKGTLFEEVQNGNQYLFTDSTFNVLKSVFLIVLENFISNTTMK